MRTRYEIQNSEPDESGVRGKIYRASAAALIAIPSPNAILPDSPIGKHVLACYPGTTEFHRAKMMSMEIHKGDVCRLLFEDDQNQEMEVERRYVLDLSSKSLDDGTELDEGLDVEDPHGGWDSAASSFDSGPENGRQSAREAETFKTRKDSKGSLNTPSQAFQKPSQYAPASRFDNGDKVLWQDSRSGVLFEVVVTASRYIQDEWQYQLKYTNSNAYGNNTFWAAENELGDAARPRSPSIDGRDRVQDVTDFDSNNESKVLDRNGRTPVALAAATNDIKGLATELRKRPDHLDIPDHGGNTPLQIAALEGSVEIVRYLLNEGCLFDCKNADGDTPLIDAVENGHVEVVKLILDAGADPSHPNSKGLEPIELIYVGDSYDEIHLALWRAKSDFQRRPKDQIAEVAAGDHSDNLEANLFVTSLSPTSKKEKKKSKMYQMSWADVATEDQSPRIAEDHAGAENVNHPDRRTAFGINENTESGGNDGGADREDQRPRSVHEENTNDKKADKSDAWGGFAGKDKKKRKALRRHNIGAAPEDQTVRGVVGDNGGNEEVDVFALTE